MKALLQRVRHAEVVVADKSTGKIDQGLLVFLGIEKHDTIACAEKMIKRLLNYRVFADAEDKMNLSVADINGGVLLVSQFTLAADTKKGRRPSFSCAATPSTAEALYDHALVFLQAQHGKVASGEFAADMQISLLNDGPVTFLLES
ncbi:MAG: D-aminoacyl-tRNA deacylase [Spongiibacteraceae bacterium]